MALGLKHVLSFDCADKTLGVCLVAYLPSEIISETIELIRSDSPEKQTPQTINLVNNVLSIRTYWLFNLLPDAIVRDTEDSVRLSRLKYALKSIRKILDRASIKIDKIIVEYQMGQNDLSRLISSAIQYEFVDVDSKIQVTIGQLDDGYKYPTEDLKNHDEKRDLSESCDVKSSDCISIGPAHKNSFSFAQNLSYGVFAAKYKTTTTANKHHTAENFKYFLRLQGFNLKGLHKEINHIADAFMQAAYWIIHNEFP